MKKFALAILVLFAAQVGHAATYSCMPSEKSFVQEEIILSVNGDSVSYKYQDGTTCEATFDHVQANGKAQFSVSNCNADVTLTLSKNFGKGRGKKAGDIRIDNHEEGGYFPSWLECSEK